MTTKKKVIKTKVREPKNVDIQALVTEVLSSTGAQYRRCPFFSLKGQARQFVDAMVLAENEGNRKVPRTKLREVLRKAFNLHVSEDVIRRHLRKDCPTCHPIDLTPTS